MRASKRFCCLLVDKFVFHRSNFYAVNYYSLIYADNLFSNYA